MRNGGKTNSTVDSGVNATIDSTANGNVKDTVYDTVNGDENGVVKEIQLTPIAVISQASCSRLPHFKRMDSDHVYEACASSNPTHPVPG
jgi:hypothetical protein